MVINIIKFISFEVVLHEDKMIELHMLKKGFKSKPGQVRILNLKKGFKVN